MYYEQRMPFGKHKGRRLADVPDSYLTWLAELPDLSPWLRQGVEAELRRRGYERDPEPPPQRETHGTRALVDWPAVLGQVRRRLAMMHHPDRGGSIEKMQGINLALDAVEAELAGVA